MARIAAAAALALGALVQTADAAFLYTFQFAALAPSGPNGFSGSAATISFLSDNIAIFGDTLTYDSGSLNGCEPAEITYSAGFEGFGTGAGNTLSCGDPFQLANGPLVDGMLFNPDTLPLTVGSYASANGAGRVFASENGSETYFTSGNLTIAQLGAAVPEPATLGLVGLSLAMLWGLRRRGGQPAGLPAAA